MNPEMNPEMEPDRDEGKRPSSADDRQAGPDKSGRPDDPLARLLRAYAARTAPRQEELEALARRVARAVEEGKFLDLEPSPTVLLAPRWRRAQRGWSMAVAAALLVGIGVGTWFGSLQFPPGPPDRAPAVAEVPRSASAGEVDGLALDRDRLRQAARRLFHETERLFPGQLLWIAETSAAPEADADEGREGRVELGIAREGRPGSGSAAVAAEEPVGPLVTIHLVARARGAEGLPWRDAWEVTVITRPEETVSFRPGNGGLPAGEWALWSMRLPDGAIALETRIEGAGAGAGAGADDSAASAPLVDTTTVQRPGTPLVVASTRRGAEIIEILQWVDVVDDEPANEGPKSDAKASREGA